MASAISGSVSASERQRIGSFSLRRHACPCRSSLSDAFSSRALGSLDFGDLIDAALMAAAVERRCSSQSVEDFVGQRRMRRCGRRARGRWRRCARATAARCRGRCTAPRGRRAPCWRRSARPGRCRRCTMPRSARPSATWRADVGADRRIVDRRVAVRAAVVHRVPEPLQRRRSRCSFSANPAWSAPIAIRIDAELYWSRLSSSAPGRWTDRLSSRSRSPRAARSGVAPRPSVDLPQSTSPTADARGAATSSACVGRAAASLGHALYSDRSQIALRMLTLGDERRRRGAAGARGSRGDPRSASRSSIDATAYRLVHGEADLLPSLIVDRYGDYLVVQALSQGMDRLLPDDHRGCSSSCCSRRGILARNDPRVRLLEGLEQRVEVLHGDVPETIEVREGAVAYRRRSVARAEDRAVPRSAREPRGRGRATRAAGCSTASATTAASRCALAPRCERGARARHLRGRGRAHPRERRAQRAHQRRGARDATSSTSCASSSAAASASTRSCSIRRRSRRTRRRSRKALSGYKEINLRALKLLDAGRIPGHVQLLVQRQRGDVRRRRLATPPLDAHADVVVVEKRMQGRDHPVLLTVPETYYLKCFILRKLA